MPENATAGSHGIAYLILSEFDKLFSRVFVSF